MEISLNRLAALSTLSAIGMFIHNRAELPDMRLYRIEYIAPTMLSLGLLIAWWLQLKFRIIWGWLIIVWSGLHFVIGGMLSVIPLPIWPFYPEQSFSHYLSRVFYSLAQVQAVWYLGKNLIRLNTQKST